VDLSLSLSFNLKHSHQGLTGLSERLHYGSKNEVKQA